jgi:FMN-dependent NADH-azoreductase
MKTLLQINTSLFADNGQSSLLAEQFVNKWQQANPQGRVIVRDLAAQPVPHLTAERFQSFLTPVADRSLEQASLVAESDELIAELRTADVLVFGLPMYNFGIPSTLKAWIDHIARAGETFKYSDTGPEGLLQDRPTYLFAARGGKYQDTPRDTQSAYMTHLLNFTGIYDIQFVYAEGLAMGDEPRSIALGDASTLINRLAA